MILLALTQSWIVQLLPNRCRKYILFYAKRAKEMWDRRRPQLFNAGQEEGRFDAW